MATTIESGLSKGVRDFLIAARVGRLATADKRGRPHNVPLCFWFNDDRFYFVIDEKPKRQRGKALKRMRNIAENPNVALVVDHYEEDWTRLAYVLIRGRAQIVNVAQEYEVALRNLRAKYTQYHTMTLDAEFNPIVRIDPDTIHVWGARFLSPQGK